MCGPASIVGRLRSPWQAPGESDKASPPVFEQHLLELLPVMNRRGPGNALRHRAARPGFRDALIAACGPCLSCQSLSLNVSVRRRLQGMLLCAQSACAVNGPAPVRLVNDPVDAKTEARHPGPPKGRFHRKFLWNAQENDIGKYPRSIARLPPCEREGGDDDHEGKEKPEDRRGHRHRQYRTGAGPRPMMVGLSVVVVPSGGARQTG